MQLGNLKTPPSKQEYTNYTIGTAVAALLVWGLGPDAGGIVDVPGEIAVIFGSVLTFIAWKLNLGNN